MSKLKIYAFILLQLVFSASSHAEIKRYNVEIVIFEDVSSRYINSEQWPVIIHQAQIDSASETDIDEEESLLDDQTEPLTINPSDIALKDKEVEYPEHNNVVQITYDSTEFLADQVAKLERSSRYNVLLHKSWQQIGLSDADAIDIQIDTTDIESTKNHDTTMFEPNINNKRLQSTLQGTLKLILRRYLHLHTDLHYKRLNETYRAGSPTLYDNKFNEFEIKSRRKMRSRELHYIDHPLLGILIYVSPIVQPELVEQNDQQKKITVTP